MIKSSENFVFKNRKREGNSLYAEWHVPESSAYFDGHFPQNPVLPAIALIDASLVFLEMSDVRQFILKKAKFMALVIPKMQMAILAEEKEIGSWEIKWRNLNACVGSKAELIAAFNFQFLSSIKSSTTA